MERLLVNEKRTSLDPVLSNSSIVNGWGECSHMLLSSLVCILRITELHPGSSGTKDIEVFGLSGSQILKLPGDPAD